MFYKESWRKNVSQKNFAASQTSDPTTASFQTFSLLAHPIHDTLLSLLRSCSCVRPWTMLLMNFSLLHKSKPHGVVIHKEHRFRSSGTHCCGAILQRSILSRNNKRRRRSLKTEESGIIAFLPFSHFIVPLIFPTELGHLTPNDSWRCNRRKRDTNGNWKLSEAIKAFLKKII